MLIFLKIEAIIYSFPPSRLFFIDAMQRTLMSLDSSASLNAVSVFNIYLVNYKIVQEISDMKKN